MTVCLPWYWKCYVKRFLVRSIYIHCFVLNNIMAQNLINTRSDHQTLYTVLQQPQHGTIRTLVAQRHIDTDDPKFYNGVSVAGTLTHLNLHDSNTILWEIVDIPSSCIATSTLFPVFLCFIRPRRMLTFISQKFTPTWSTNFTYTKRLRCEIISDDADFLQPVTPARVNERIAMFADKTSNQALQTEVCIVCAQEMARQECLVIPIGEIPNPSCCFLQIHIRRMFYREICCCTQIIINLSMAM